MPGTRTRSPEVATFGVRFVESLFAQGMDTSAVRDLELVAEPVATDPQKLNVEVRVPSQGNNPEAFLACQCIRSVMMAAEEDGAGIRLEKVEKGEEIDPGVVCAVATPAGFAALQSVLPREQITMLGGGSD